MTEEDETHINTVRERLASSQHRGLCELPDCYKVKLRRQIGDYFSEDDIVRLKEIYRGLVWWRAARPAAASFIAALGIEL